MASEPSRVRACEMPDLPVTRIGLAGIEQPPDAFQQAPQHLAAGCIHVDRQCDDVIDHDLRRQIALADTRPASRLQDRVDLGNGNVLAITLRLMRSAIRALLSSVAALRAMRSAPRFANQEARKIVVNDP